MSSIATRSKTGALAPKRKVIFAEEPASKRSRTQESYPTHAYFKIPTEVDDLSNLKVMCCRLKALGFDVLYNDYELFGLLRALPLTLQKLEFSNRDLASTEDRIQAVDDMLNLMLENGEMSDCEENFYKLLERMSLSYLFSNARHLLPLRCFSKFNRAIVNLFDAAISLCVDYNSKHDHSAARLDELEAMFDQLCLYRDAFVNNICFNEKQIGETFEALINGREYKTLYICTEDFDLNVDVLYKSDSNYSDADESDEDYN